MNTRNTNRQRQTEQTSSTSNQNSNGVVCPGAEVNPFETRSLIPRESINSPPPSYDTVNLRPQLAIAQRHKNPTYPVNVMANQPRLANPENLAIPANAPTPNQPAQVNLGNNQPNHRNQQIMSNQTVPLKDALKVIPEYDGENIPLTQFLIGLDESFAMIETQNELNLTRMCRSKLLGKARRAIQGRQFNTIEELKTFLKNIYFSSKTVYQLQGELGSMIQYQNEPVINYANRIKDLGLRLIETYRMQHNPTPAELTTFRNTTDIHVMQCFKRGLKGEIEQKLGNEITLDELVKNAIRIEREIQAKRSLRNPINPLINPSKKDYNDNSWNTPKEQTFNVKCKWCDENHYIRNCPEFKK